MLRYFSLILASLAIIGFTGCEPTPKPPKADAQPARLTLAVPAPAAPSLA